MEVICILFRLEGKEIVEVLRGKRVVMVGDSLNRNMWQSLLCLLRESVADKNRVSRVRRSKDYFAVKLYVRACMHVYIYEYYFDVIFSLFQMLGMDNATIFLHGFAGLQHIY